MGRNRSCAGNLARIVAAVLAACLALMLPLALLGFNVGRVLFSPEVVAGVIVERAVDSGGLRRIVSERLLSPEAGGGNPEFELARAMSFLEQDEVERVLDLLIPPEWARAQVGGALESLYAWMDNDSPSPVVPLDLRPIQQSLLTGGAERLVETILDSWPACTVEQIEELAMAAIQGGEVQMPYCEPPEPYRSAISLMATQGLIEGARALPPTIDLLGQDPAQSPQDLAGAMALKEQLRLMRALARWGWLLPLSFLGIIMALVVRSFRGLTRWWGIPLLIGGLLSVVGVFVASGLAQRLVAQALGDGLPEELVRLLRSLLDGLRDRILGRMLVQSVVVTLGAVLLLFLGYLLGRRKAAPSALAQESAAPRSAGSPVSTPRPAPKPPSDRETPTGMFG